jgi:hypothetical protein
MVRSTTNRCERLKLPILYGVRRGMGLAASMSILITKKELTRQICKFNLKVVVGLVHLYLYYVIKCWKFILYWQKKRRERVPLRWYSSCLFLNIKVHYLWLYYIIILYHVSLFFNKYYFTKPSTFCFPHFILNIGKFVGVPRI